MPQESCPDDSYGRVAEVYDHLMEVVPHGAWIARIEAEARARRLAPRSVLDLCCGTGIGTRILLERGYAPVVGVDASASMIAQAEALAVPGDGSVYVCSDAGDFDLDVQHFDMAISLFDSLNYILDEAHLSRVFRQVRRHLVPGGLFAFDMNSIHALKTGMFTQSDQTPGLRHNWISHWDDSNSLCTVEMDFWVLDPATRTESHFREIHRQRGWAAGQIVELLRQTGFTQPQVFGNYGYRTPRSRSDRWLFATQAPS